MLKLGTATLQRIVDFDPFVLPLGFIFPGATAEAIRHAEPILAPHHVDFACGNILLGLHSLLLRSVGLNILIDAYVDEDKERPRRAEWHRRGRWVPTFPNARYLIGRAEMAHWQVAEAVEPGRHNHGAYADSVLPVIEAGLSELVDDGFDLAPGMKLEMLPGHSPGQMGLFLDCGGAGKVLFCGDAVHSPVQVFQPEWASAFCSDREQAISTRLGLFERSSEENTLLIPAHLRDAWGMRVERKGSGYGPIFVT